MNGISNDNPYIEYLFVGLALAIILLAFEFGGKIGALMVVAIVLGLLFQAQSRGILQ